MEATIEHITINGNELKTVPVFGNLSTLMSMNLNSNQVCRGMVEQYKTRRRPFHFVASN